MEKIKAFLESTAGAIIVLFSGLLVYSGLCVWLAIRLPGNERISVIFAGILGNFNGSLFTVITIRRNNSTDITGDKSTVTINESPKTEATPPIIGVPSGN